IKSQKMMAASPPPKESLGSPKPYRSQESTSNPNQRRILSYDNTNNNTIAASANTETNLNSIIANNNYSTTSFYRGLIDNEQNAIPLKPTHYADQNHGPPRRKSLSSTASPFHGPVSTRRSLSLFRRQSRHLPGHIVIQG